MMMEEEHARLILSICTHVIKRRLIRVLVESRRSSSLLLPRSQPRMLPASSSLVRRRRALLAASLAFGCYAYHQRWLSRLRASLAQLGDAAGALREALASGSLCLNTLSSDLAAFLCAEDEVAVPASLRQLLRLLQCDEAQGCVRSLGASLADGLSSGASAAGDTAQRLLHAAAEGAASERGRSLLVLLVSAAARQCTVTALEVAAARARASPQGEQVADAFERLLGELDSDRGRRVAAGACSLARISPRLLTPLLPDLVTALVRGAVATYLREGEDTEVVARQLLSALADPEHRAVVSDLAQRVTGEAVRVLIDHGAQPPAAASLPFLALRQAAARAAADLSAHPRRPPAAPRRTLSLPCSLAGSPEADSRPAESPPAAAPAQSRPSPRCLRCGSPLGAGAACACNVEARQPPGWAQTARMALSLAAAPEARSLVRDVAGAAAGACVRALVIGVPQALYASLPSLPLRRRRAEAAAAAAEAGGARRRSEDERHWATPGARPAERRGAASDEEGETFHDASPVPYESDSEATPLRARGSESAAASTRQSALALALCVHAAALSGVLAGGAAM